MESDEESGAETEHPVGRPNWRGGQRESRVLGECTHPPRTKPQQSSCRGGQTKLETQQASHEGYEAGHSGRGGMEGPGEEEGETGEQVLAGAKMRATGRELMRMAVSTARGAGGGLLYREGGIPGMVINKKDNASPQALGYSSLWFIFS